jgi:nitrile hydratase
MTEDEDDWRRAQGDRREHPDDAEHPRDAELTEVELRVQRLEALLVQKGVVRPAVLDELIDTFETRVGPRNGAEVIARAWADPAFKQRLLEDATEAIAEMGFVDRQGGDIVVLENSATVHNLVVCTLCSCYPWPVLGLPPVWYKSAPYRSRAVIDPRGVLREFGVDLPDDIEVRVWDSTAEVRYLVLPERPPGTEGMTAEVLAGLVTRDAMIGTARVNAPDAASHGARGVAPEDGGR